MKALPASDGRNWTKQAEIHNNSCVHGNWWSSHGIVHTSSTSKPIWQEANRQQRLCASILELDHESKHPRAFLGGRKSSPEHNPFATQSSVANSSMVGSTTITNILSQTNFFLFASDQATTQQQNAGYGMLEGTPHNYIHGFVGGEMGTYMSPLDAIFWCHHNMIECLWVDWNINKGNANTNDPGVEQLYV